MPASQSRYEPPARYSSRHVRRENAREVAVVEGLEMYPVTLLSQAVSFLNERLPMEPFELDGEKYTASFQSTELDFADLGGQESVERAITVAAAGGHNLLTHWTD